VDKNEKRLRTDSQSGCIHCTQLFDVEKRCFEAEDLHKKNSLKVLFCQNYTNYTVKITPIDAEQQGNYLQCSVRRHLSFRNEIRSQADSSWYF
jgi:hypothetical protein